MRPVAMLLLAVAVFPAGASTRASGEIRQTDSSPRQAVTTGDASAEPGVKIAILNDDCRASIVSGRLLAEELRKSGCDVTEPVSLAGL